MWEPLDKKSAMRIVSRCAFSYREHLLNKNLLFIYCENTAVNALLNHYGQQAREDNIALDWKIRLPGSLPVADIDLCSILGNILENAITACLEVPAAERRIQLSVTTLKNTQLCIVSTNSFSGRVKMQKEQYLSTRRDGNGIGLSSIQSAAEKYGGHARFTHTEEEFFCDVIIPL